MDPLGLGLTVEYITKDACPEYGGKPCPAGQHCEQGKCIGGGLTTCSAGYYYNSISGKCLKDCERCSNINPCRLAHWAVEYPHTCEEDPVKLGSNVSYTIDDSCGGCSAGKKCSFGDCVPSGLTSCPSGYVLNYAGTCYKFCDRCSNINPCRLAHWAVDYPHTCEEDPVKLGVHISYWVDDSCGGCPSDKKCNNGECTKTGL